MTRLVTSILHPSHLFRGRWKEVLTQAMILQRVGKLVRGEQALSEVLVDPDCPPDDTTLWPTRRDLETFQQALGLWPAVSIDIESVGHYITIVGFTLFDPNGKVGPTIVVPFKKRGGLDYWVDWKDHLAATEFVYGILEDERLQKWMQNGITFDVPMLREAGFDVRGELWDTMILSHYTYPEMPKSLQYLSTAYLGMPNWKGLLDEGDDNEAKS